MKEISINPIKVPISSVLGRAVLLLLSKNPATGVFLSKPELKVLYCLRRNSVVKGRPRKGHYDRDREEREKTSGRVGDREGRSKIAT